MASILTDEIYAFKRDNFLSVINCFMIGIFEQFNFCRKFDFFSTDEVCAWMNEKGFLRTVKKYEMIFLT